MNNGNEEQGFTRYGKIGLAIYLISFGLVYLVPNNIPDGTLYLVAGVLVFAVIVLNTFKGISADWFDITFATVAIVVGTNKMIDLELNFLPAMFIVVGLGALFTNIKKLKYQ